MRSALLRAKKQALLVDLKKGVQERAEGLQREKAMSAWDKGWWEKWIGWDDSQRAAITDSENKRFRASRKMFSEYIGVWKKEFEVA